jgi:hypothetical protein
MTMRKVLITFIALYAVLFGGNYEDVNSMLKKGIK